METKDTAEKTGEIDVSVPQVEKLKKIVAEKKERDAGKTVSIDFVRPESRSKSSRLQTAKQVRERLGNISDMGLWRWLKDPELGFPRPIVINNFRYWDESEIDAWIESRREVA